MANMESCECFSFLLTICRGVPVFPQSKREVVLYIRENESEKSQCKGRVPYDGVGHLGGFREFLEGCKEKPIVPWPFDFWDSQLSLRIATELEHINSLEMHEHVVTIVKSDGGESRPVTESTTKDKSSAAGRSSDLNEAWLPATSLCTEPNVTWAPISSAHDQETSFLKLEPKHKIFLSHSGAEKPFVAQLCKDLEDHNHFPFFDQRPSSLPIGEEYKARIIDAAKNCQVAVVVLSREYLSSKWPMLELVGFVRARRSENKSLKLFPIFYKASVDDLREKAIREDWRPSWKKFVGGDIHVDLDEWAAAVRELRSVNGLNFEMFGSLEVPYRDKIVDDICKLVIPDLLFDTSKICGRDRICETLASKFLLHEKTSAQVLGLFGMGGLGKTTMAMALCNHFIQRFSGRVCYIEINEGVNACYRQQVVMRKLLRPRSLLLQRLNNASEGWKLLQSGLKEYPIFLVIDNVQSHGESNKEAQNYLNMEYNSSSKIMVISRSLVVVKDLLGDLSYCFEMPCLTKKEATMIFLQQGAPQMDYFSLTKDEKGVIENCLRKAWFPHQGGHYHPLALEAVASFLRDRSENPNVMLWNNYLPEYEIVKDMTHAIEHMFRILGLQFYSLDKKTQLMFIDICLYAPKALECPMLSNSPLEDLIAWLAGVHQMPNEVVRFKILDFKRFAMINIVDTDTVDKISNVQEVIVHDLYKEFAIWFLEQVGREEEVRGVWCIGQDKGFESSLPPTLQCTPRICWPELKRIWLENIRCDGFAMRKLQEWCNVVVLQIVGCENLTTINLQGLACLRHLELKSLRSLKTLTFLEDESTSAINMHPKMHSTLKQFSHPSLQYVIIDRLSSLELLPSLSSLINLVFLKVVDCTGLTQPPSIQHCSSIKRMFLSWDRNQKTLSNLEGLTSLQDLTIRSLDMTYTGSALKLEGLSCLISLRALDLFHVPVGDLSGLERLTLVEYVSLVSMNYLTSLLPLHNLVKSSLHMLEVRDSGEDRLKLYDELRALRLMVRARQLKEGFKTHTPSKINIPRADQLMRLSAVYQLRVNVRTFSRKRDKRRVWSI